MNIHWNFDDGPSKPSVVAKESAIQKMYSTVIFFYTVFHFDFKPEDSKSIFLEDNPTHDDASSHKFGSKRFRDSADIILTNE